jgi:D-glycero-D-manno-heptose 1,7-bisphosphate phosphatase
VNKRPAAFLDRDGTLIVERYYLADPAGVELVPTTLPALRRLQQGGYALVLVTNQSGIARGLYSLDDFLAVQARLVQVLRAGGVTLDGVYFCPHHPQFGTPCDCRKPAVGLFRRAAAELDLDLARSAYIGDRLKDVQPAAELGGRGIMVRTGYGAEHAPFADATVEVVNDLAEAAVLLVPG